MESGYSGVNDRFIRVIAMRRQGPRLPLVLLHAGDFNFSTRIDRYGSLAISGLPSQSRASSNVANWCSRRVKGGGRSF